MVQHFVSGMACYRGGVVIGYVFAGVAMLALSQVVYLALVLAWVDARTSGNEYFGQTGDRRARFRRILGRHALLLAPTLWLLGKLTRFHFPGSSFTFRGVAGPKGMCSVETFAAAVTFKPRKGDVFVATQMKCGTTWMQHLVYQVLTRGQGDIVAEDTTLCAVSPWLESRKTIAVADAPEVPGTENARIIKTHLPVSLCPYCREAKYIYVVRHPVSCFASCTDFLGANLGYLSPPLSVFEEWFCGRDSMWWGTWPAHVQGWWKWSQLRPNVLFLSFEQLKSDLSSTVRQLSAFLACNPLSGNELENILHKCSFSYMREHEAHFSMHPPQLMQRGAAFFVSGKGDRHADVPEEVAQRIKEWCRAELLQGEFPLSAYYPDVAQAGSGGS
ncbi:MAG: sulfotransferase domain-containing protein [Acidobacteriota bacterium]|nr:sulfotransferase domain-containing protein [Acidobacteriota bacterium]